MTTLLIISYISFIGLGLPDSLLGSAWTVMHGSIGATTEFAGVIAFIVSLCTVISSLLASRLIYRLGTGMVAGGSVTLTVIAVAGYSFVQNPLVLLLCAVPLGI